MQIWLYGGLEGFFPIGSGPASPQEPHKKRPQDESAAVHPQFIEGFFGKKVSQIAQCEEKGKYYANKNYDSDEQHCKDIFENFHPTTPLQEQV